MKQERQTSLEKIVGVVGVVLISFTIFSVMYNYDKAIASKERSKDLSDQIQQSFHREFKLQEQLTTAIVSSNQYMADGIRGQLEEQREYTRRVVQEKRTSDAESDSAKKSIYGAVAGTILGAGIFLWRGPIGAVIGAGFVGAGGAFIGHAAGNADKDHIYDEEMSKAIQTMRKN